MVYGTKSTPLFLPQTTSLGRYYNDWDQYDPDAEVDKIEDEAEQRRCFGR